MYLAAAQRHILQFLDGEEVDPDTGVHHLGYARVNLGIILDALETSNLEDDRPKIGSASSLIKALTSIHEQPTKT